jgi:hypothetical protein
MKKIKATYNLEQREYSLMSKYAIIIELILINSFKNGGNKKEINICI